MDDDAARIGLVGIERDFEPRAERIRNLVPRAFRRIRLHEPAGRFERAGGRGEAVPGEEGCHHARARGGARVERLGHRPELLAHADRLRRGDPERHRGLRSVEVQHARTSSGGYVQQAKFRGEHIFYRTGLH